jgi:NCAIR mutase (PurE)-related protein
MDRDRLAELLGRVRRGETREEDALEELARLPFVEMGDARLDTHRALRQGFPEVVLGLGKTTDQLVRIVREIERGGGDALVTRVEPGAARTLREVFPGAMHYEVARIVALRQRPLRDGGLGPLAVVSAGTADVAVAEEAAVTAELLGNKVERLYDVGVAGLHRLLASLELLRSARVAIVVAGMEGALPSVVGGLIDRPVVAVPTSVGYGASFGGLTALLGMLNSCASNVAVVNVDNGFGAAFVASLINRA